MAYLNLGALGVIISRTRSNRDIVASPTTDDRGRPPIVKTQRLPSVLRAPYVQAH